MSFVEECLTQPRRQVAPFKPTCAEHAVRRAAIEVLRDTGFFDLPEVVDMSDNLCSWVSARIMQDRIEDHLAADEHLSVTTEPSLDLAGLPRLILGVMEGGLALAVLELKMDALAWWRRTRRALLPVEGDDGLGRCWGIETAASSPRPAAPLGCPRSGPAFHGSEFLGFLVVSQSPRPMHCGAGEARSPRGGGPSRP